jgi:hypothetical protein
MSCGSTMSERRDDVTFTRDNSSVEGIEGRMEVLDKEGDERRRFG